MIESLAKRNNLQRMEKTFRPRPVTTASVKAGGKPSQKKSSRTTAIDLLPQIRKVDRAAEHLPLLLGNLNLSCQPADSQYSPRDIFQLIPGKLSLSFHPTPDYSTAEIKRRPDLFLFSSDLHERYMPFCDDYGPVNIGIIYVFWQYVRSKEHHPDLRKRPLVYYTYMQPKYQINAAFLLGTYMMLEHNMTAAAAASAIEVIPNIMSGYRDATYCEKDFEITLRDCFMGLQRALQNDWFNANTFDLARYEELENLGDLSLIGTKFVAFRGPRVTSGENDDWVLPPRSYTRVFRQLGVSTVIRLNEEDCYDKEDFKKDGFEMHDLEFADCSCPPPTKIKRFLDMVDSAPGKVAVHCRAGLGRTGTMIALWMMKNRGFSAREAIAWLRLCRPGSVIGPQQQFLVDCESVEWAGNLPYPCTASRSKQDLQIDSALQWTVAARRKSLPPMVALVSRCTSGPTTAEELAKQVERGSRMRSLQKSTSMAPHCDNHKQRRVSIIGCGTSKSAIRSSRTCSV